MALTERLGKTDGIGEASNTRRLIIDEARRRGWEYTALPSHFGRIDVPGLNVPILFKGTVSITSNSLASRVMSDKAVTSEILESLGFSVPRTLIVKGGEIEKHIPRLQKFVDEEKTVVVKPNDSSQGKCIRVGIATIEELIAALKNACEASGVNTAVVQSHLFMNEFRILVFEGHVVAASTRGRAFLVGDGKSTAREMILSQYDDSFEKMRGRVKVKALDAKLVHEVAELPKYARVLKIGERLQIDELATDKLRGSPTRIKPEDVHKDFNDLATKVCKSFAAVVVGLDLFADDITKPLKDQRYYLTELNPSPGTAAVIDKEAFIKDYLDSLYKAYKSLE